MKTEVRFDDLVFCVSNLQIKETPNYLFRKAIDTGGFTFYHESGVLPPGGVPGKVLLDECYLVSTDLHILFSTVSTKKASMIRATDKRDVVVALGEYKGSWKSMIVSWLRMDIQTNNSCIVEVFLVGPHNPKLISRGKKT